MGCAVATHCKSKSGAECQHNRCNSHFDFHHYSPVDLCLQYSNLCQKVIHDDASIERLGAKHTLEDRVDVLGMVANVELFFDFVG